MPITHAKDARQLSEAAQIENGKEILKNIEMIAKSGHVTYIVGNPINVQTIKELTNMGFEVSFFRDPFGNEQQRIYW